ncbi:rhamnogalacturonyl hydrolase YesR [Motilibacter rhizosphaerae]|uniref:Rhamnogalacturonyl hydrolase YesR n=1 Tax=Motilibacter rhizosphaerae TaxID=598652 RepID=A0A4Q7NQF3_9ACTN|nr:glycoside hydrolase family 88 protein [Motilibacter rhizosphaerae]RZS87551.1 rhamnogalacturonyl hydrolase YesR [Motilibacter rhizosphaerae]
MGDGHRSLSRRSVLGAGALLALGGATRTTRTGRLLPSPSSRLPLRADVLRLLRRVDDAWIADHPAPGDADWARSTYLGGHLALTRLTGDPRYLRYAGAWADANDRAVPGTPGARTADDLCAAQAYLDLAALTGDRALVRTVVAAADEVVAGPDDAWWWVDALHMAMPVLSRVTALTGDDAYATKLWTMYADTKHRRGLYSYDAELWWRDARFVGGPEFWSRGNGWAAAAHAKVLGTLPRHGRWPEYRSNLQGVARSLLATQRADGAWSVDLGQPGHFPVPETSGTALHVYALAAGVRLGMLDRGATLPAVARGWQALVAAVAPDGSVGRVQPPGDSPESGQPVPVTAEEDFGVGALLLAGCEVARLVG